MSNVSIKSKVITNANILQVSAGTNCPQGGDAGHGGRTYFKIENQAGTSMVIKVNGNETDLSTDGNFEVILAGDTECETFLRALKFAVNVLENQLNNDEGDERLQEIDIP